MSIYLLKNKIRLFIWSAFLGLLLSACSNVETVETRDEQGRLERYERDKKNYAKEGLYRKFHLNGNLQQEAHYMRDTLHGERRFFYENGVVETVEHLRNGTYDGKFQHFYPNGVLQLEQQYVNGALQGLSIRYYQNGVVEEKVTLRDNEEDGPFIEYYENGNLKAEGHYVPGSDGPLEQGELKEYDENGQLIRVAACTNGVCLTKWKKETEL